MENLEKQANGDLNPSLKLAIAMAIVESRRRQKISHPSATTTAACNGENGNNSESDAIKWKRKFLTSDGVHQDVFPQNVSCKCYFYDNFGQLSPKHEDDQKRFGDVLHRRFLRQVRLSERKRKRHDGLSAQSSISALSKIRSDDNVFPPVNKLYLSCQRNMKVADNAVEAATLKPLSSGGKIDETIESIVSSLIVRLMRRMCNGSQGDGLCLTRLTNSVVTGFREMSSDDKLGTRTICESLCANAHKLVHSHNNFQFYVQHLMRKLGSDPYVGQRVILSVSQRISIVAESLLFMDPFDGDFPKMHNCMYLIQIVAGLLQPTICEARDLSIPGNAFVLFHAHVVLKYIDVYRRIQLIEFLISDNLLSWSTRQDFDTKLLEEWVISIFNARRALELLESRNALYMLYMDRVVGDLTRRLGHVSFLHMLRPDTLEKLFG
ncbi:hypothetical protein DH2020_010874 [Rehmannia glutinosa]|uniref:Uncharacterized protein n=1 Tax=Rehmannia glutinosa TaxID=99300 RepID=A0ABR0XBW3_REHGL